MNVNVSNSKNSLTLFKEHDNVLIQSVSATAKGQADWKQ